MIKNSMRQYCYAHDHHERIVNVFNEDAMPGMEHKSLDFVRTAPLCDVNYERAALRLTIPAVIELSGGYMYTSALACEYKDFSPANYGLR